MGSGPFRFSTDAILKSSLDPAVFFLAMRKPEQRAAAIQQPKDLRFQSVSTANRTLPVSPRTSSLPCSCRAEAQRKARRHAAHRPQRRIILPVSGPSPLMSCQDRATPSPLTAITGELRATSKIGHLNMVYPEGYTPAFYHMRISLSTVEVPLRTKCTERVPLRRRRKKRGLGTQIAGENKQ